MPREGFLGRGGADMASFGAGIWNIRCAVLEDCLFWVCLREYRVTSLCSSSELGCLRNVSGVRAKVTSNEGVSYEMLFWNLAVSCHFIEYGVTGSKLLNF